MSTRRILHHGPTPQGTPVLLSDRAINGCWFELHRQGGCGAGELVLQREFQDRLAIEIGDWISCEVAVGQRWYLGRVEECRFQYPGLLRLRLAGMAIELNEVFPGGFSASPVEQQPQRYGATDLFSNDPDRNWEAAHSAPTVNALVRLLLQQHVVNKTSITYVPSLVESPRFPVQALTAKFRGEESLRSILKDLALRAQANWGVDAFGRFFFIRRRISVQSTYRLGRDLVSFEESRDRELIFNRLLLTGDYIYDHRDNSGQIARRVYRWRGNYFEPRSCVSFGNRRLRLWVPWIRTQSDSLTFAREFFRNYSQPSARYSIETLPSENLLIPWEGTVSIEDASGAPLATGVVEKVRILFDHAPRFRLEVGHEDPREQWPEPPQDERWELPDHVPSNGGDVSLTDIVLSSDGGGGGSSRVTPTSSNPFTDDFSDLSSDLSESSNSSNSSEASDGSSEVVSWDSSPWTTGSGSDELSVVSTSLTSDDETSSTSQNSTEDTSAATSNGETSVGGPTSSSTASTTGISMSDDDTTQSPTSSQLESSEGLATSTLPTSETTSNQASSLETTSSNVALTTSSGQLTSSLGGPTSSWGIGSTDSSGQLDPSDSTNPGSRSSLGGTSSENTSSLFSTSTGSSSFWTTLSTQLDSSES